MLLSKGSVKLRSLGLSPFVLALTVGLAGAASTGCFYIDEGHHHTDEMPSDTGSPDPQATISQVSIQPDQTLDAAPGEGVGIFVEYRNDGSWYIWTTCDTFSSKAVCSFDMFVSMDPAQLRTYATDQVEGYDEVKDLGGGQLEFIADTDSDTDGLVVQGEPGAPLQLEMYLDGNSAEKFVYWVSDNVMHPGAPSNPVQFIPAK